MGEWKHTICNFCAMSCNLEVLVEDGHILDVRPDQKYVRTALPYCCRKGRSIKYLMDDKDRLDYPLKKVGDHFEKISWEQAYREIGEKGRAILEKHGPRAYAQIGGTLATDQSDYGVSQFMTKAIGSQNKFNPVGVEFAGHFWANGRMFGSQGFYMDEQTEGVDAFILWGSNSYVSHNIMFTKGRFFYREIAEDPNRKLIVIDPRLSESARMADMHIMPRPGTDTLLARGIIAMMVDMGLEDKKFLNKWCSDWDKAKKWYKDFDYRRAFEVCEVPFDQMKELVEYMGSHSFSIHQDLGIYMSRHNTVSCYLINTIMAVTGNVMVRGLRFQDMYVPFSPIGFDERSPGVWRSAATNSMFVACSFPEAVLAREILSERDDRIRMAVLSKSNPMIGYPDCQNLAEAFSKLELFVVSDIYLTETAKYADYVLPGKTGFEEWQWSIFSSEYAVLKHPIIGQIAEREEGGMTMLNIAKSLGLVQKLPKSIYKAAAKSVKKRDIIPFLGEALAYFKTHPKLEQYMEITLIDALARPEAFGSASLAALRLAFATSWLASTKSCDRAGYQSLKKYRFLNKLGPAKMLANISKMDQAFWALYDSPYGVKVTEPNPDPEGYAYEHIHYPDHKFRLYDDTVDEYLNKIVPDKELAALKEEMADFPMLISSGNHGDEGGVNAYMRNGDTYVYRNPYTVLINPVDAEKYDIKDGQQVKISTKRIDGVYAPAELTYKAPEGYCVIPNHYGMETGGKTYGQSCALLTRDVDMDPITGNPYNRFVPCRIEPAGNMQQ